MLFKMYISYVCNSNSKVEVYYFLYQMGNIVISFMPDGELTLISREGSNC